MVILPESCLGKWSVGLISLVLILLLLFFLCMLFGLVTFDEGNWWNITVAIAAPAGILGFILSKL